MRDQIFYANDGAAAVLDQHGDVHLSLTYASPITYSGGFTAVLPRRVAEQLLKRLAEALMPDEPEASGEGQPAEPELPLAGDGWEDEKPVEAARPWRERFGVES